MAAVSACTGDGAYVGHVLPAHSGPKLPPTKRGARTVAASIRRPTRFDRKLELSEPTRPRRGLGQKCNLGGRPLRLGLWRGRGRNGDASVATRKSETPDIPD